MIDRRNFVKALGATTGAAAVGGRAVEAAMASRASSDPEGVVGENEHLVGTWGAANVPPAPEDAYSLSGRTLRQVVNTSIGGSGVRVRLTNQYGPEPVTFDRVSVGVRDGGASVESDTLTTVTFDGQESVFVPAGALAYSDPVEFEVDPDQDVVVSIYASEATGPATRHPIALKQTYVSEEGDYTDVARGRSFSDQSMSWYFLDGVDVVAPERVSTVVALGDSITDGFESTAGADNRYPDYLARRIADRNDVHRTVVNAGLSGNRVLYDSVSGTLFGENAVSRIYRDVVAEPAVTDVILMEGINDIGQSPPEVSADQIIAGLKQIVDQLHVYDVNVFLGTLTPAEGTPFSEDYYADGAEQQRQTVNEWIRSTENAGGVVDFDRALRNPANHSRLRPEYDSGDHLHPNDEGYEAMADEVDLGLFKRQGRGN